MAYRAGIDLRRLPLGRFLQAQQADLEVCAQLKQRSLDLHQIAEIPLPQALTRCKPTHLPRLQPYTLCRN